MCQGFTPLRVASFQLLDVAKQNAARQSRHASRYASPARMSAAGVKSQIELSPPTPAVCNAVQKRSSWLRVVADPVAILQPIKCAALLRRPAT